MGECLTKGADYEIRVKQERDLFLLKMKYFVFGEESLSKKERKHLKTIGVIKPVRRGIGKSYFLPHELDSSDSQTVHSQKLLRSSSLETSLTHSRSRLNFSPDPSQATFA